MFPAQQRGPGRHPDTARRKWNKEVNKVVMKCFYRSRPFDEEGKPIRGYRQRMFREWKDKGMFKSTEQRVSDQARAIRKNGWELEMIRRKIDDESQQFSAMDESNEDEVNMDLRLNDIESGGDGQVNEPIEVVYVNENDDEISQENKQIVDRLKKIILEGRTSDGILFKKINKKSLRAQTEKVNSVAKFVKTKSITETN